MVKSSKKKEKVDVTRGKGIELLPELALTKEGQMKEVYKKRTGAKPGVVDVTKQESSESEANSWGRDEDDSNDDHDSGSEGSQQEDDSDDDKTQSNNENKSDSEHETDVNKTDETNVELKIKDKAEGDKDEGMDYTTNMLYDDVDVRLNNPIHTDEGFVQKEGANAEMTNAQQGKENLEIKLE
ncbi:hypothetical protein Tco_1511246 [Tanacetum coccineum]